MQDKKQQLEPDKRQWTGSKLGKEYYKAVYCHPAYLTYMQSESESEVTQSCPTLCNPVGYSPSGSSVHGVLQARILEWVAISFHHMRIQRELCNLEEDLHLTTQAPDLRYQPPEL